MAKKDYTSKLEQSVSQYVKNADEPKEEVKSEPETKVSNQADSDNIDENKKKKTTKAKAKDVELKVQSYHMTPVLIEAIRLLKFKSRKKNYEVVQELLLKSIPADILEEAARIVEELKENNEDE